MQMGRSGGLVCSGPGTLGVLVKKASGGSARYILSCSHVLAKCGQFNLNFADVPESKRVIQQPVDVACNAGNNRIGLLTANFSKVIPRSEGDTTADIALALLDPTVAATVSNIQTASGNSVREFASEDPSDWHIGMHTQLLGAVSGASPPGKLIQFNGEHAEEITFAEVGKANVKGLARYSTICAEGDSGGAVIDDQDRLLGIHI